MFPFLATVFGVDQGLVLVIVAVVSTVATFGTAALLLFFALAPYVSEEWATELGIARTGADPAPDTE